MNTAILVSVVLFAQSSRPAFEVASVREYKNDGPRNSSSYGPQGITFRGIALGFAIGEAYNFPVGRIIGPGSMTNEALWPALSTGYDIVAKAEHQVSKDQLRLMLQTLLEDRFSLKLHRASKTLPVYKLTIAKTGLKLQESVGGGDLAMNGGPDGFIFRNAEMMRLAGTLSGQLDRPAVDGTGLSGFYNFTLKRPDDVEPAKKSEGVSPDSPSAALYSEALKELGLELTKATAPVDFLVVDSVQKPSEN